MEYGLQYDIIADQMDERVEYDGRIERFSFKLRKTRAVTHNTIIFDLKQF